MDSQSAEAEVNGKMTSPNKFRIDTVSFEPMVDSIYLRAGRMRYNQGSRKRAWDLMFSHASVACLLFHVDKRSLVFVKQFRPAVYANRVINEFESGKLASEIDWSKYPSELGVTHELCAGIVDKSKSLVEIMHEEILEECGYNCPLENICKITSFR
uniref:Nudix hydrolase domain-containing protein n=1 Tax=Plectus sambesii TaxID=2011161 RepID=A0A914UKE2_9BILA